MKNLFLTLTVLLFTPTAFANIDHSTMDHSTMDHSMHHMSDSKMKMTTEPAPAPSNHDMHHMADPKMEMKAEPVSSHSNHATDHSQHHGAHLSASDNAYMHANHIMHEGMAIEFTGNPDIDFLRGMIPHHQGAVDMAKVQLEHGNNGSLKGFTKNIIRAQEREIRWMKINLETLELENEAFTPNHDSTKAFKHVNHDMHQDMNIKLSSQADADFVRGMIPHHQGAVDMAKVVLEYGKDANNKRLAYDIINEQESEITWMKRWLHLQRLRKAMR